MQIAVVGAGNAGCAYAWHLSSTGHEVRLLKTSTSMHEDNFVVIQRCGGIRGVFGTSGRDWSFARLSCVTRDERQAIEGCEVVIVLTQTGCHENIAKRIGPLLGKTRLVLVVPGYMGSLYFRSECPFPEVLLAEGESSALDARIEEPGAVRVLFKNVRNALAFLPASRGAEGLRLAAGLLETYSHKRVDIVESSMHNPNLILHPLGTILSASRIEHSHGDFRMYKEAFTPSVWNAVDALDLEKRGILNAFGLEPLTYGESCRFRNSEDLSVDPMTVFASYAEDAPRGPSTLETRFIDEDVPMGLALMSSLGRRCGRATPVCDALVNIAGALRKRDFWAASRNLEGLGIGGLTLDQTISAVRDSR